MDTGKVAQDILRELARILVKREQLEKVLSSRPTQPAPESSPTMQDDAAVVEEMCAADLGSRNGRKWDIFPSPDKEERRIGMKLALAIARRAVPPPRCRAGRRST